MSETVIKVDNLSKIYDLGLVGTGTISKDINRAWAKMLGKPDPYATLAELNDRTQKSTSGSVFALKDINFDVKRGDILGIIGKNGAGKSTLLKILSQITSPSTGEIKIKGRVASLLEVGTGMHPEMTARENIYLNGAIMGMTRREITSKLDEIVDFAGIGKYLDTPIKRFSSGMKVRLGFAVAAFLEPEILIVDEVLAVGDAEFQKKAIGKMQDVTKGGGRTVLFVSHNMAAVNSLCTRGLVLENGTSVFEGDVEESIDYYLSRSHDRSNHKSWKLEEAPGNDKVKLLEVEVKNTQGGLNIFIDDEIIISYKAQLNVLDSTVGTTIRIINQEEQVVFSDGVLIFENKNSKKGIFIFNAKIPSKLLNSGNYRVLIMFGENKRYVLESYPNIISFDVLFGKNIKHLQRQNGAIYQELKWSVEEL